MHAHGASELGDLVRIILYILSKPAPSSLQGHQLAFPLVSRTWRTGTR